MSLTYITPPPHLSTKRRLPGSPHWGGDWRYAVANLRAAVKCAIRHARWQSRFTADEVGTEVIDLIGQLDSSALPVLHVVIGELAKQSKRGDHRW